MCTVEDRKGTVSRPLTVLVADDDGGTRHSLSTGLASRGLCVAAAVADGVIAVDEARRTTPDVALVDVRMPRMNGVEVTAHLMSARPPVPVVLMSVFDEDAAILAGLRAGAMGFVLKTSGLTEIVRALQVAVDGGAALDGAITRRFLPRLTSLSVEPSATAVAGLSARELQVLALVADGLSNAEVAQRLVLGVETVKSHVARLLRKLSLRDRTQLAVFAHRMGLARIPSRE